MEQRELPRSEEPIPPRNVQCSINAHSPYVLKIAYPPEERDIMPNYVRQNATWSTFVGIWQPSGHGKLHPVPFT
jgi:hypothetical protein